MVFFTLRQFQHYFPYLLAAFSLLALGCGGVGLYSVFYLVPDDYLQGNLVKIMYIHVPVSWLALFLYTAMAACSLIYLSGKNPLASLAAQAIAPVGLMMTVISLTTGSIWGKPTWGTWWVWDARLTSMLILLFIYIGCLLLRYAFLGEERGASASAIFTLVGLLNIPIIKFSVNIWHTLHQPSSVFRLGAPTIHASMLYPLGIMFIAIACLAGMIIILNIQTAVHIRKYRRIIS